MWPESARNPRSIHDLFNFRLGRLFHAASLPVIRLCEAEYGIARREWGLISVLGLQGEMSPSALSAASGFDRPRTSRALGQLVRKGLVARDEVSGDRRHARVRLTEEGRVLYDSLLPRIAEVNRSLLSILSDADLVVLDDLLSRLGAQARQLREECATAPTQRRLGGSRRIRGTGA